MSLLSFRDVWLSFGDAPVLAGAAFGVERGERVCLVGRNGEGKSSTLRLMAGSLRPDRGEIERVPQLKTAMLEQEVPKDFNGTVYEVVAEGLGAQAARLRDYHAAAKALAERPNDRELSARLDALHRALDAEDGWQYDRRVACVLTRLELDGNAAFSALSGGRKRRALLARALVDEPDLLLLDEPTNHLDMASVAWLEKFLKKFDGTIVFVTHDRAFLKALATRIVDLDRGVLTSWDCDYETYREKKEEALAVESAANDVFDKKLAREEVWIRRGIEARRTRNEGRVRALEKLRRQRAARRDPRGTAALRLADAETTGRKVIDVRDVSFAYGDAAPVVRNFSTTIWRGDRIGIVGPNGCGKTTLLRLLLGELAPTRGEVLYGTRLETAYFDQHRAILDENLTLGENVCGDGDRVRVNGASRHIVSYLRDFLFSPQDIRASVRRLSGGERARAVLAKLFLTPANVWVLDEPTNDLDLETQELLEALFARFDGTLLVVSHDREFLKNVVNATFVLDGSGDVREFAGCDARDWMPEDAPAAPKPPPRPAPSAPAAAKPAKGRKLSNRERAELERLPAAIEAAEAEYAALMEKMADPAFYRDGAMSPKTAAERGEALQREIAAAYAAWEALEARAQEAGER